MVFLGFNLSLLPQAAMPPRQDDGRTETRDLHMALAIMHAVRESWAGARDNFEAWDQGYFVIKKLERPLQSAHDEGGDGRTVRRQLATPLNGGGAYWKVSSCSSRRRTLTLPCFRTQWLQKCELIF